jgi:S1-C subfamily serine protease
LSAQGQPNVVEVPKPSANSAADAAVNQLRETRYGWLGVRIQAVTDDIAESLNIKSAHGALVAGVDEKGPARLAGIEAGDVIVKFDGKDIKEMRDLPGFVADTPVGKNVDVVIIRKGKEENRVATLGRLYDGGKQATLTPKKDAAPEEKSVVQKTLGLNLSNMTDDLRSRYKIKGSVKGVVITGVDAQSDAADKRLSAGDVIVEASQEQVASPADLQKRVDQLKKEGRKSALFLVANAEGVLRFVALTLQAVPEEKLVVQKTLGLNLSNMTDDLRGRYKIKDSVKGVVITGVDAQSLAADKRLNAGDVIVEASQEQVASAADLQKRVDQLKKEGRKAALLLVANAEGEMRFVALTLQ